MAAPLGRVGLVVAGAFALATCGKDVPTVPDTRVEDLSPPRGFAISEALASAGQPGAEERDLVYVSASPGTFADGLLVEIINLESGAMAASDVVDGGFDPVSLSAAPGDELKIDVHNGDGGTVSFRVIVPTRKRPRVVRTRPPMGATDIALNASVGVVFSEPVLKESVTSRTVRLMIDQEPVDGVLSLRVDGLYVQLTPDEPLRRRTVYTLLITTGIVDLDGDPLEETVEVRFTTEDPPATGLSFVAQPGRTHGNRPFVPPVEVVIHDRYGDPVPGWSEPVTVALATNPWGARLAGETTAMPVNGVARFANLRVDRPGAGYALSATSAGLPLRSSEAFEVYLEFASVHTGFYYSCGRVLTGDAYCWGYNGSGRLGDGTAAGRLSPVLVSGGVRFASISARTTYACGVTSSGEVFCWGENFHGQLGDGTSTARFAPVPVAGTHGFTNVSTGARHTCGVTFDGEAYCWGDNFNGQLGDGTTMDRLTPVHVGGSLMFRSVSAGLAHTCGLATDGRAYCWGANDAGELGNGTTEGSLAPVPVAGGLPWQSIEAGHRRSCGITTSGDAYCWGMNDAGQVGDGTTRSRQLPTPVSGGLAFTRISLGPWRHTCGVTASGDAYCWGENQRGQLGDGTTTLRAVPVKVSGELSFVTIDAGLDHTCGVTTSRLAYCWGANRDGQLGDATTAGTLGPEPVIQ